MSKYIFILFFCTIGVFAQNINQYKYVEVPQRFDFQKEKNTFNLNTTTKLLLEKYGFVVYMDDQVKPLDAANNMCKKTLRAEITEESSMFVRKLTIKLLDCQNNVVFASKQGTSTTKDLRVAYNQALRMAFESFDKLGYKYGEDRSDVITTNTTETATMSSDSVTTFEFNAKVIDNGFLLQSSILPDILMKKSTLKDFYIVQIGDFPGMIYKENSDWKLEYYQNGELQSKLISIQF